MYCFELSVCECYALVFIAGADLYVDSFAIFPSCDFDVVVVLRHVAEVFEVLSYCFSVVEFHNGGEDMEYWARFVSLT